MRKLIALLLVVGFSTPALAWDGFGHMVVAARAWDDLTPATRTKVTALLKESPYYDQWASGADPSQADEVAFVVAATWPDQIKNNSDFTDDADKNDRPKDMKIATQNIGWKDMNMHKYWHFVDMPFSPDGTPLENPTTPNAETQVNIFRDTLANGKDDDVRSYDLMWLLHLVGDVHQPLHATSRFSKALKDGDHGGNLVKFPCSDGSLSCKYQPELHAIWDNALGTQNTAAAKAITRAGATGKSAIPTPADSLANVTDVHAWVEDSFAKAQSDVYMGAYEKVMSGLYPAPTKAYKTHATSVAADRVGLAGARLAKLITAALK